MDISVTPTPLDGLLIVDTRAYRDHRGYLVESYHKARYAEHGIDAEFVQDNHSFSIHGVLRGLHFQDRTAPMGKLVRCTEGSIFDVAVDLRPSSPTFGRWYGIELSAESMRQLWIPPGFAHGFQTLSHVAQVQYRCTAYYCPSAECVLAWNDVDLAIDWPLADPIVSARDEAGLPLEEYRRRPRLD